MESVKERNELEILSLEEEEAEEKNRLIKTIKERLQFEGGSFEGGDDSVS